MGKVVFKVGEVNIEMEQEEVSKAIETGEVQLNSDELIAYKKEDFEQFKTNLSNDEYKKGKTAGVEMTIKDAREKHGLDFEGKSFDNFTEAFKNKILEDAKIEPSKKIQELESDKAQLLTNYQTIENEFNTFKTNITEKETRSKKDNTLLSFIPDNGLKVDKDITLMALKNKAGVDLGYAEDGSSFITVNGNVVKDEKTLQPVDPNSYISQTLTGLDLIAKKEGGPGGGDDLGGQAGSYEKFVKEMEANGKPEGSMEFSEEMTKRIKDKTLTI